MESESAPFDLDRYLADLATSGLSTAAFARELSSAHGRQLCGWQWHFLIDPFDPAADFDKRPVSRSNTATVVWVDFIVEVCLVPEEAPERAEIQIMDHGAKLNARLLPTVHAMLGQAGVKAQVHVKPSTD